MAAAKAATAATPPEGSTTNLPPSDAIAEAEVSREADVDALFGISNDDEGGTAAEESAASGGATTPAAAGEAAAGTVDGQPPAAAEPPPAGTAVPGQPAGTTDGTSSAPPAQQPPQGGTPPAPAAAPAAPAPVDPNLLKVNSLEATVQALTAQLAALQANPPVGQQPQGGGQPPAGQATGEQVQPPAYNLSLPPAVAAAINSGDEQQTVAGITHMMNSLASIVHHNVRLEMRHNLAQLLAASSEQSNQSAQTAQAEASRNDYYAAFPAHKDPLILPIIQAESMAMAGEFPNLAWDDNYRNALGQRVEARLAALRGGGAAPVPVPPNPAPFLPSGARTDAAPGTELTGGELIADTFS